MRERGKNTYSSRRRRHCLSRRRALGLHPWTVIELPWGRYERHGYLFWRIRILLWLVMCASGWAALGIAGLAAGAVAAYGIEGMLSYRKPSGRRPAVASPEAHAAARAHALRIERRWDSEAAASPAGWRPPAGARPAWQWSPPDGLRPRLDRVPGWVRLWYRTPILDRYAYSWMWERGGWDVLPPSAPADGT
jgi:hypothetical protein